MTQLSPHFWQEKFETRQTGWDRGQASPQLMQWLASGAPESEPYTTHCRARLWQGLGSGSFERSWL